MRLALGTPCADDGACARAGDLLAATAWDGDLGAARVARDAVLATLGLGGAPAGVGCDENAPPAGATKAAACVGGGGYQALVDAAERGAV